MQRQWDHTCSTCSFCGSSLMCWISPKQDWQIQDRLWLMISIISKIDLLIKWFSKKNNANSYVSIVDLYIAINDRAGDSNIWIPQNPKPDPRIPRQSATQPDPGWSCPKCSDLGSPRKNANWKLKLKNWLSWTKKMNGCPNTKISKNTLAL